ncbi:BEL1-like homeodomain protein 6 [Dendrobium catenatum]|uniref:BEL1-like homeodomain protein 6 n=1 Tax=Dendrobium catenatum TaxID=906689 RepID=A0A2I0VPX0_9ASPA|nr:BEL1-like homeodomain protein 6 [Dendrobium catenatum]
MATFYSNSSNQRDAMENIYLRDPAGSEPAVSGNMVHLNFPSVSSYSNTLAGTREKQANCIGVSDLASSHIGDNAYSSWRDGRNVMLFMQAHGRSLDGGDELIRNSASDVDPQLGLQTPLGILNEHNLSLQQSMSSGQGQGLSLSLGTQIPVPSFKYQPASSVVSGLSSYHSNSGNGETYGNENSRSRILNANASPYGFTNTMSTVPNSKYIKAAQQLLDEFVNIQRALKKKADNTKSISASGFPASKDNKGASRSDGNPSEHQESSANSPSELSTSEKQELQNKLAKLLAMLDEVDRKFKQYFNEMQIVDASFDAIAGSGAAKPYTALALQTISRHFRSLRDAIDSQIRSSQKILGEQDGLSGKGCGISRLRYIDQHMRQQKTIQQLGVMPQHAWRPQRGLPENSVSILRAWLFEHFLHPYPNDSEKLMLARQTGLTRSQISNWFINARVRLWKPMVEDIYKEEFGENEMDSNSSSENATKYIDELCNNAQEDQQSPSNERCQTNPSNQLNLISETNTAARVPSFQNEPMDQRPHDSSNINPLLHDTICNAEGSSRLMTYTMNELARYDNGGVSLTLGLQHCDDNLPASDVQEEFLASRGEDVYSSAPSIGFGPSQLLNYFVA